MMKLLRSLLAGGAATAVDLLTLALLVSLFHMDPRAANVPALVAGGIVSFFGNRHFAFRAADGSVAKQALGYVAVEIVALILNGVLFDVAMHHVSSGWYGPVRLATSHVVFLAWSYPLWRFVFRVPRWPTRRGRSSIRRCWLKAKWKSPCR